MSAGISRVHGYVVAPSQRPSTISFYNLLVPGNLTTTDTVTANGAFDQIFRTALDNFATVAMIGTPTYNGSTCTQVNFAIEDTGVMNFTAGAGSLGLGSGETYSSLPGSGNFGSTAAALTGYVQALGSNVNGFNLTTAAVYPGVFATTSISL